MCFRLPLILCELFRSWNLYFVLADANSACMFGSCLCLIYKHFGLWLAQRVPFVLFLLLVSSCVSVRPCAAILWPSRLSQQVAQDIEAQCPHLGRCCSGTTALLLVDKHWHLCSCCRYERHFVSQPRGSFVHCIEGCLRPRGWCVGSGMETGRPGHFWGTSFTPSLAQSGLCASVCGFLVCIFFEGVPLHGISNGSSTGSV